MSKDLYVLQHSTRYLYQALLTPTTSPNDPFIMLPIHSNLFILPHPLQKWMAAAAHFAQVRNLGPDSPGTPRLIEFMSVSLLTWAIMKVFLDSA